MADWGEVGCGEKRAAADVAADADPYSGVAVYRAGSWSTVGGTSLASPIIASTFALAGGSGGVSYPAQTVYGHLGSGALHDVTSGSNGECTKAFDEGTHLSGCTVAEEEQDCQAKLICRAGVGYDGPTGVGTPDGVAAFRPPAPAVTSISPDEGELGTEVTIGGEHLRGVSSVEFDGVAATHVVEVSATELTASAPGHASGQVDVIVTTGGGTSATAAADHFTYLSKPAIAGIGPAQGTTVGGTEVTIMGEGLGGVEAVSFGGAAATDVVPVSSTEVKATSPAHAEGSVDVAVTTPGGTTATSPADRFEYLRLPVVEGVAPAEGPTGGGTSVTITGHDLDGASAVTFGGTGATHVVEVSATELTATSPAHAEGRVDVTVTTPVGTSDTEAGDGFTYVAAPTSVSPPTISGTAVEGETLGAGPGGWERGGAFTYEWLRCDSSAASCNPFSGATASSYTLTSADVGHRLEVRVSTSDAGGPTSATSAATAIVAAHQSGGGSGGSAGVTLTPAAGTAVGGAQAPVKGGKAVIMLRCTGGACSGTLLLEVAPAGKSRAGRRLAGKSVLIIGRASFSIAAGGTGTFSVQLTGKGQATVRKAGKKGLEVQLVGTGLSPRQLKLQEGR